MDPDSDIDFIHTITIKIIKQTYSIGIGIVEAGYNLETLIQFCKGYCFFNNGNVCKKVTVLRKADEYTTGDIVSLTLNLKSLSLSYNIIKNNDNEIKKGMLVQEGQILKRKYKWAVAISSKDDCVEIIDIYARN